MSDENKLRPELGIYIPGEPPKIMKLIDFRQLTKEELIEHLTMVRHQVVGEIDNYAKLAETSETADAMYWNGVASGFRIVSQFLNYK